jgi:hypothetical protein
MTTDIPADLPGAASALADLLEQENRLLAALELAAAADLLAAKESAATAFLRARKAAPGRLPAATHPALVALLARLRRLATDNRRLLERGLAAQGRVIAVIGRAARTHARSTACYGASGRCAGPRRPAALAISARI